MLKHLKILYNLSGPVRGMAFLGIFLSVVTALSSIALMAVSGWFIAAMALAGAVGASMNYFTPAAAIRAFAVSRTAGRYAERLVSHDAALRFIAAFRPWLFERIETLPQGALDFLHSGYLMESLRRDSDRIEKFYLNAIMPLATAFISAICVAIALFFYDPRIALLWVFAAGLAGLAVPLMTLCKTRRPIETQVDGSAILRIHAVDGLQGMGELLIYGRDSEMLDQMDHEWARMEQAQKEINRHDSLAQMYQGLIIAVLMIAALSMAMIFSIGDHRSLAMLPLMMMACLDMMQPLPAAMQITAETRHALHRVFGIIDQKNGDIAPVQPTSAPHPITFHNVSFRYTDNSPLALRDINLTIQPGQSMAITGPTGSGKSSIINLLAGLHQPTSGTISGLESNTISIARQKPYIFAGTLRSNLLLANPNATQEQINQICAFTGLDSVIANLPNGEESFIGQGGIALSGGQTRRLSITRALLKPAQILILDEPDEGLDQQEAATMLDNIQSYTQKSSQTLLLITHTPALSQKMQQQLRLNAQPKPNKKALGNQGPAHSSRTEWLDLSLIEIWITSRSSSI
jgi:ATP-binding cassette subfamily C protein CydC